MSRHFLEFKLHLLSFENQINKVEGTKAWGKSPFVTYTDAYTSTYYLDMYTFLKSIYASLNFHMCLQNMTPPKFLWVLCCVRYDKIVFQFFFCIFSFCCIIFFLFVFFSFLQRCISLKKKRNKIYIKKRNSWVFFVGCKFPPDKRGRTTGQTRGTGTNRSVGLQIQTIDVKKKWNMLHCTHGQKVTTAVLFFFYTEQLKGQKKQTNRNIRKQW